MDLIYKRFLTCSMLLSSGGLWTGPTEFSYFGGKFSGDGWQVAVDGEPAEEWTACVRWDAGGCGLGDEQCKLLLRVSYS